MSLQIIGAGFGRTGTMSLKHALETLGFGPCYHMVEVKKNEGHRYRWNEIAHGAMPDWDDLFRDYRAAIDWPATHYWDALARYYPDAKVILTVRDPEAWYRSFSETIRKVIRVPVPEDAPEEDHLHRDTIHKIITEQTFHGQSGTKEVAIRAFEERIKQVIEAIPKKRLLVYEITQGWGPLCEFLDVPVPDLEFPKKNTTEEFLAQDPRSKKAEQMLDTTAEDHRE